MSSSTFGQIHEAPVTIRGEVLREFLGVPLGGLRLISTDQKGRATIIPFQIDEVNPHGEFVLNQGPKPNSGSSNGILDNDDELLFMGNDVGSLNPPVVFTGDPPLKMLKIAFNKSPDHQMKGAVYLAYYDKNPPALAPQTYVSFDQSLNTIATARYRYVFDGKNYLVLKDLRAIGSNKPNNETIIHSSTFYLSADLKYFFTFEVNHRSVNSRLEAFKVGPIRVIVRVDFFYSLLKLNIDVGMYTEVSFFSNAVELPAIFYSPMDGRESLNSGSIFYYGFAFHRNPQNYRVSTNLKDWSAYRPSPFGLMPKVIDSQFWLGLYQDDHMIYLEIKPSDNLLNSGVQPYLYMRPQPFQAFQNVSNDVPASIDKAPVNTGLVFDLTRFSEGRNEMGFRLFFDSNPTPAKEKMYQEYRFWQYSTEFLSHPVR